MSGIAGFYQLGFDYTQEKKWDVILREMRESLIRRGPNGNGTYLRAHAGLAQTRLSVMSRMASGKPISKYHEGRECALVYNGELYNAKELKLLLTPYKLEWQGTDDAETLLNGYLAMGSDFFKELNGNFAFAIYDSGPDVLLLCRDRAGAKPLFYQQEGNGVVFGSEPKALFAYGIIPKLNLDGLREIFGVGPARTLGNGVFQGMNEVLPGHFLKVTGEQIEDCIYWQLMAKEHTDSYEQTVEKVTFLVHDSIKRQMASVVPIGSFLSGGLDSSVVSALCAKELAGQEEKLDTFSFEFSGNNEHFKANDFQSALDRPFVDIMVSHIGSHHTYLSCDNRTQADYLYQSVDAADLPCMGDIESSLLYFCSQAAMQNQVVLTGEGADEIFGGYPWFHKESALQQDRFPWSSDMSFRTSLLREDFLQEAQLEAYAQAAYDRTIAETPRFEGDSMVEARRREIAYLNLRWFMVTLLNRMDRSSMYSGLQARVPFGDYRIVEYLYNIPWEMKCHNGVTKSLLIEAGKELLPESVLYRKKSPYPKTYDPGYEALLGKRLMDVLLDAQSPLLSVIDKKKVKTFLENPSDYGKPWYGQLMAGPQMLAYLLQVDYWMRKHKIKGF